MTTYKGVVYFKSLDAAMAIEDHLLRFAGYPTARVVSYDRGFAVQYYPSGPYYPEKETSAND